MSTWLDGPPAETPFARAMQSASHVLIIPNSTVAWNGLDKLDIAYFLAFFDLSSESVDPPLALRRFPGNQLQVVFTKKCYC
jgi:hypothetical protein